MVELKDYTDDIRQVIVKGNGREKPSFLISNDLNSPMKSIVGEYSRRWRVEIKVHFDVIMTMIADT